SRHDRILAGARVLYESTDRGDSWHAISGFTNNIEAIGLSLDPKTLYVAAAGNVQASHDGGSTWLKWPLPPPPTDRVRAFAVSPANPTVAYFVRAGLDKVNVFKTTNGGEDWINIEGNLPNTSVSDILIYAYGPQGTATALIVATDQGVFTSADEGASWKPLGVGFPISSVRSLSLFEHGGACELFAGTNG